ncbi:MAG: hypothetical protein K6A30_09260 [Lachnospiraceae bacterium]|nr:hypothetical protein [Lachnospiraceae bacterium]
MKFRDRVARAMYGRYGNDQLNKGMLVISILCLLLSSFARIRIFYGLGLVVLLLAYVRMFSKNIPKRYQENQKYLSIQNSVVGWLKLKQLHAKQRKMYRFYACPTCGQKVRVPKGKGKIEITCPQCRQAFVKRS